MTDKHILLVSYSQTGQLGRLCGSFIRDLAAAEGIHVETAVIEPLAPYPFPWPFFTFFDTFPETVLLTPPPVKPLALCRRRYDLVILAYTVWFLSPAQPVTAFVQSPQAQALLRGTPVVTLIGCRNMWLMAQEKMKTMLAAAGARLVGNVVKTDRCTDAASFISTPLWMLTGKRQAASWLPAAGISDDEIADAARFGRRIAEVLRQDGALDETLLRHMGAVKINERLIASERIAARSFAVWGRLLAAAGRRAPLLRRLLLCFYIVFLITMILTVAPVNALLKRLAAPLTRNRIRRQKAYYAAPSGE